MDFLCLMHDELYTQQLYDFFSKGTSTNNFHSMRNHVIVKE